LGVSPQACFLVEVEIGAHQYAPRARSTAAARATAAAITLAPALKPTASTFRAST
jgi:hypothetical protein